MKELFPTMGLSGSGKSREVRPDDHRVHGIFQPVRQDLGEHIPEPHEAFPLHRDHCEIEEHPSLPACPYRRAVDGAHGTPGHYVCDCAGGFPIGVDGVVDPQIAEICGSCNIPLEIDPVRNRRSCLFLIPVRIWESGRLRTGFSCRWFYNFKPSRLPGEAWLCCLGCPHWFPRPQDETDIPRMMDWIHRIIRLYWEPEPLEKIWGSPPPPEDRNTTSISLLSERLSLRIKRFREALRTRRDRRASLMAKAEE